MDKMDLSEKEEGEVDLSTSEEVSDEVSV